ncbi:MAG: histidinol-phosphatase, partial [Desulfocucumaceae bacterium]
MPQYLAEAGKKGLKEIGISDHVPMYWLSLDLRDPGL